MAAARILPVSLPLAPTSEGKFANSPKQIIADLQCAFFQLDITLQQARKRVEAMRNVANHMCDVAEVFESDIETCESRCLDSHGLHVATALLVATTGAGENLKELETLIRDRRAACLLLRQTLPLSY